LITKKVQDSYAEKLKKTKAMKLYRFLIILTIYFLPKLCLAQNNKIQDSTTVKVEKLKKLYFLATNTSGELQKRYRKQFFEEFPNSFKELNQLYGYDDHKAAPLYDGHEHIVGLFNNLDEIDELAYYKKIISIAIGGRWDADAVNYFQDGLRNHVLNNPALVVGILKEMDNDKIQSFWYFFFDGAHPERQIAEPLKKIKSMNGRIYDLMIRAHTDVLKQDE
jgi:hypothetical protein